MKAITQFVVRIRNGQAQLLRRNAKRLNVHANSTRAAPCWWSGCVLRVPGSRTSGGSP